MADDDVFVHTVEGTYKIPAADLERYRTEEEAPDVEEFAFGTFDPNILRPSQDLRVTIGTRPTIRQAGHVVFSVETVITRPG